MSDVARQFRPDADLESAVDAFWLHTASPSSSAGARTVIYPDGCIDLIFYARRQAGSIVDARLFVAGASESAYPVTIGSGESYVGVRFRPAMSRVVVDADPAELLGRDVTAREIDSGLAKLAALLTQTATPEESLALLRRVVSEVARANAARRAPHRVRAAIALLTPREGPQRIHDIAYTIGTSVRSVHRDIVEWTGLSPQRLSRIFRFQAALAMLHTSARGSLSDVAFGTGYADHAHMTREFRALAGVAPSELWPIYSSHDGEGFL